MIVLVEVNLDNDFLEEWIVLVIFSNKYRRSNIF
jgi:hypothetical protein